MSKIYNRTELVELLNLEIPEEIKFQLAGFFVFRKNFRELDWWEIFEGIPDEKQFGKAFVLKLCHSNNRLPEHIVNLLKGETDEGISIEMQ